MLECNVSAVDLPGAIRDTSQVFRALADSALVAAGQRLQADARRALFELARDASRSWACRLGAEASVIDPLETADVTNPRRGTPGVMS